MSRQLQDRIIDIAISVAEIIVVLFCVVVALAWFAVMNPADARTIDFNTEPPIMWWLRAAVIALCVAYVVAVIVVVRRMRCRRKANPFDLPDSMGGL